MGTKVKDKERKLRPKELTPKDPNPKGSSFSKNVKGHLAPNLDPYSHESKNLEFRERVTNVLARAGFTREMVEVKVSSLLLMNTKETRIFKDDPDTSNFDLIIIAVIEAAQRNADTGRLDNLLDKIFGKTVNVTGTVTVSNEQPVTENDAAIFQRALERAIKNNV